MTDEQATMEQAARAITALMAQGRRRWNQLTPLLIVETLDMAGLLRQPVDGDTSDGYHTFDELYKFRLLYNAALFNEWAAQGKYDVHKSKRHSDGELCFGGEGWFIVMAQLPTGQISNHYPLSEWDLFDVPSRLLAAEWDGHTSRDVSQRLYDHLMERDSLGPDGWPGDRHPPECEEGRTP